jgi:hypothetical protein
MEHKGVEYTVVQMADGSGWTRSRTVEMPSGLSLPLAFGINTLLIAAGDGKSGLAEAKPNPV